MNESIVVIDKHVGPTSFDMVRSVRKRTGIKKVGHSGSLDPFATGVLVLLLGRATKLSQILLNADKRYRAVVKLGDATDSLDSTGEIVGSEAVPELAFDQVNSVLKGFEGVWEQIPPMYSAKKVNGVRLYRMARKNQEIEREPIAVDLHEVKLLSYEAPFIELEVHCSKGTYVRSLAAEIGKRLGTVAHLHGLRRLSVGQFNLEHAVSLTDFEAQTPYWLKVGFENYLRFLRQERHLDRRKPDPQKQRLPYREKALGSPVESRSAF